ncbi:AMP-dependent synthetase/ligase [Penicillium expansum]|uniref:AMP-dependent synthetase/ligase n=1 Tax=Penicillium expansum TaxID=27334 RepID=A0A0A2JG40_PENEN|nr:AMP-dependent synthetase/ligase [Penicillium expansum]KGO48266.1 AMP-dependent synthetase/ligase [Penicillium expansum]KGO53746.1 AMP-dependent synthetase/ligase [Penicillium expansum]
MSGSLLSLISRSNARVCFTPRRTPFSARLLSTLPNTHIFRAIQNHDPESLAVVHSASSRSFTYGSLIADIVRAKDDLEQKAAKAQGQLAGERVAFLAENSYDYVVTLLAIFASDAIALPLSPSFPTAELKYILDNSQAKVLLATEKYADKGMEILREGLEHEPLFAIRNKLTEGASDRESVTLHDLKQPSSGGMMLYTSGTTNRPKGVLIPQSALAAQASSLLEAWKYTPDDRLLHLLPLHHIHGVVNAIVAPIVAGSSIEFMYPFNPDKVWKRLAAPFLPSSTSKSRITFLTAVPTIYNRLMATFPKLTPELQTAAKEGISPQNLRLNISGSAALPTPTKTAWTNLSNGNVLLERFGMTEVGMAISCGLDAADRVDGSVGWPLPGVEARLADLETGAVIPIEEKNANGREREGEIQLRGETIFDHYWGNEKATRESFVQSDDGGRAWFCTGDVATRRVVDGAGSGASGAWAQGPMYFIQGRKSVDIIKTGAEKVSALEVERELLSLPQVTEAAVVGLPSEQWGQKIAAVVVLSPDAAASGRNGQTWGPMDMRRALKGSLASFKIPQEMRVLEAIPRNAMGKVNKKALVKEVFDV